MRRLVHFLSAFPQIRLSSELETSIRDMLDLRKGKEMGATTKS